MTTHTTWRNFWLSKNKAERYDFARRVEASYSTLNQAAHGRPIGHRLAVNIERESGGIVTRPSFFPETWQQIWPELIHKFGESPRTQ